MFDDACYSTCNFYIFRSILSDESMPDIDINPLCCYFCRIAMAEFLEQCVSAVAEKVTRYKCIKFFDCII